MVVDGKGQLVEAMKRVGMVGYPTNYFVNLDFYAFLFCDAAEAGKPVIGIHWSVGGHVFESDHRSNQATVTIHGLGSWDDMKFGPAITDYANVRGANTGLLPVVRPKR